MVNSTVVSVVFTLSISTSTDASTKLESMISILTSLQTDMESLFAASTSKLMVYALPELSKSTSLFSTIRN